MIFSRWGVAAGAIALPLWLLFPARMYDGTEFSIQNNVCTVAFDPATLAVKLRCRDYPAILVSAAQTNLGSVAGLERSDTRARWSLPDRKVTIAIELEGSRLLAHILAEEPGEFTFPIIPETASAKGWILPFFEGVYAPCGDAKWKSFLTNRLKEAGADCVKILLYYTTFDDKKINDLKQAWTERIGDECKANDIPFFLELIGYKEGVDEKGAEYAKLKPEVVAKSMEEFTKDRYGVDVLKVEIPVNLQFVEGAKSFKGTAAYTKKGALDHYRAAAGATNKPFIYLSAGVSNPEFIEDLEFAAEAGVKFNGVLCGRATWKDGIPIFAEKGAAPFRAWLEDEGVKNIGNVNNALKAATPWYSIYEV